MKRLSKDEMRMVMGGNLSVIANPCPESECESNEDCSGEFPKCHKSTCLSTGDPSNICGYDV